MSLALPGLFAALHGSPQDMFAYANSLMDVDPRTVKAVNPINVEDAKVVTVGNVYLVNVANVEARHLRPDLESFSRFNGVKILVPFLGELHDDPDLEPEVGWHWHIDWRFFSTPMFEAFSKTSAEAEVARREFKPYDANLHLAVVIKHGYFREKPYRKALVCRRVHSLYNPKALFLPYLEQMYQSKRACNNICPHRGISLVGAPEDANGVRVCPGHGLAWSREGKLVPRTHGG